VITAGALQPVSVQLPNGAVISVIRMSGVLFPPLEIVLVVV
jgi:hypothetical protein